MTVCRDKFRPLGFKGAVKLVRPEVDMFVLMDFSARESVPAHSAVVDCFFGRRIHTGGLREELKKYSLKQR